MAYDILFETGSSTSAKRYLKILELAARLAEHYPQVSTSLLYAARNLGELAAELDAFDRPAAGPLGGAT